MLQLIAKGGNFIIRICLFDEFSIEIDDRQIVLPRIERELLALLVVVSGRMITAKNYWEIIEKPKKHSYNARLYSSATKHLMQLLSSYDADSILETGLTPVRFCRINMKAIICDYYDMLDGKTKVLPKESFLSDYPWASELYCQSREELNNLLRTNPLFIN